MNASFTINPGEKYALVALRTAVPYHGHSTEGVSIGNGLWATCKFPIKLEDHWKDWIGSVRVNALEKTNLIICSTIPSSKVEILDEENEQVKLVVSRLYQCLLFIENTQIYNPPPVIVTGAYRDRGVDVRQLSDLPIPYFPTGVEPDGITWQIVHKANTLRNAFNELEAESKIDGGFKRFFRILNIHHNALLNPEPMERLHQFCRCLEGFILPEQGKTKRQFRTRTELFVGTEYAHFMERLYDMRSLIAHLNKVHFLDWPSSEHEQRIIFSKAVAVAESLSRYCIARFLTNKNLWEHFRNDDALNNFWKLNLGERQRLWGDIANLQSIYDTFNPEDIPY